MKKCSFIRFMIKKTTDIFWIAGLCLLFSGVFCATNAKADTMAASSESNSSVSMTKTFLKPQQKKASIHQQISYRNDAAKRSSSASPRESVKILKYKKKILLGETKQLDLINLPANATVSFSSNNTSVLTVKQISNTACEYSGMGYGNAKIQIKISTPGFLFFDNVQELTASINVTPKAVSIVFRKSTRTITVGQSSKLSYTIRPSISTEKPVFSSLRKKIVSVNKKGMIKGKKSGTTYVYATLANGKSAKCKVIVKKPKPNTLL